MKKIIMVAAIALGTIVCSSYSKENNTKTAAEHLQPVTQSTVKADISQAD